MEERIIKSQIFDTKTILNETSEQPIDVDFTLPEYYPDIRKILKCSCVARISSKGTNGTSVTSEGTATVTAIYIDEDNMLNSYEYQYPFSKSFSVADISGSACICISAKTDYINCRAVTARKIDIHGAISITAVVTEKEPIEIISDIDSDEVELLRKTVFANTPVACSEKSAEIKENIEIGAGIKDINCIIRYDGAFTVKESKLIGNKAMVKGELCVNILYCNDDGEISSLKENIPFSQMIEVETVSDNCGIDTSAEIQLLEIKPKSDAEGKTRSFDVSSKILICVDTYCNNETEVILDAYQRKYETKSEKREVVFNKISETLSDSFNVKESVSFEPNMISKVFDMWCKPQKVISKTENGKLTAEGSLSVCFLMNDADNIPFYAEKEIPFSYSADLKSTDESLYSEPVITVGACSYTLTGESSMEVRAELNVFATVYECCRQNVLTEFETDYEKPAKRENDCAMTVYFASSGESVWEIASRYLADITEIKQINEISEDILSADKTILVPLS